LGTGIGSDVSAL